MAIISTADELFDSDVYVDLGHTLRIPLHLKCEGFNFAGSVKLRAATSMVASALRLGLIDEHSTMVESSSGNLGVALSVVAAARSLRFVCVTDPKCNPATVKLMRAFGSDVVVADRPDADGGYLTARKTLVRELCSRNSGYVWLNQYENPANWLAHYENTAPLIAKQFPELDVLFIAGGGRAGGSRCRWSRRPRWTRSSGSTSATAYECAVASPGTGSSWAAPPEPSSAAPPAGWSGTTRPAPSPRWPSPPTWATATSKRFTTTPGCGASTATSTRNRKRAMAEQQGVPPQFSVVPGAAVHRSLEGNRAEVIDLVEAAYRRHGEGGTVNPPSYFLRFPDRPTARIIALPASVGGTDDTEGTGGVDGIKWISSFPTNLERGVPRASAVLLLNDPVTGYPYACLEGSIISAARTAASATAAARRIAAQRGTTPRRIGFFGTGLIARFIQDYLTELAWDVDEYHVFDLSEEYASSFGKQVLEPTGRPVVIHDSAEELVRSCDLVVFATTAGTPHVTDPDWFSHHPVVLHVSLRDLGTDVILDSVNIVDDVEHVLKADTSVHLAEQLTGGREFLDGTFYDVLTGDVTVPADRTVIFSPFGLGILDLAVGAHVHRRAVAAGEAVPIGGFFHELDRHQSAGAS